MSDPTFDNAVDRLQEVRIRLGSGDYVTGLEPSLSARAEVLERYQPLFAAQNLPHLTEAEFRSFLMFRNNKHWSGLHRLGPRMCKDMDNLQQGLQRLLYGDQPMAARYDQALASLDGVGRAVATAILLIVYPEQYGVWNTKSEAGLKRLNLWPRFDRGESEGSRYLKINDLLLQLCAALEVDLWTLDALWHYLLLDEGEEDLPIDEEAGEAPPVVIVTQPGQHFGLERHLQDFLWDNWDQTELGQAWERHTELGDERAGYEYPCAVGRIDILARHRVTKDWLVVELKRAQTSDGTLGQVMRYMGWVRDELAEGDEQVKGLIIGRNWDQNLYYALKVASDIDVMHYRVSFALEPATPPNEATP